MKTTTRWTDGAAIAVRAVLASAYRGKAEERATATLADIYCLENPVACPTCPRCAKKAGAS